MTVEFKQDDRCYLAVEAPEGAYDFSIYQPRNYNFCHLQWRIDKVNSTSINLKTGGKRPKIIGIASKLTEEQAKEMVDMAKCMTGNEYFDYQLKRYLFNITATESLKSRLTSLKLSDNVLIIQKL